ncbi:hypothetical protein ACFL1R_01780 [Candidatus Latescibacterota bacterium]
MGNWTDNVIKQHIEDLIEESYLSTLSEPEIKKHFSNFVKSCENVLQENVSVHGDIRIIRLKIALLGVHLFLFRLSADLRFASLHGKIHMLAPNESVEGETKSNPESLFKALRSPSCLAQHVIQTKRSILKLLDEINPKLTETVLEAHKKRNTIPGQHDKKSITLKEILIESGYYVLLFITFMLLFIVTLY